MGKEQKKLVLGAASVVFLLLLTCLYAALFTSNSMPFKSWKQKLSNWRSIGSKRPDEGMKVRDSLEFLLRRLVRGEDRIKLDTTGFSCHSDLHSELCLVNKPVRIDDNGLTVYIPSSDSSINRTVKPYANRDDATAMSRVSSVQIVNGDADLPACHFSHNVPAVVFCAGGFAGNLFHEINEVIIPLFITSRHFQSHLKFVITDYKSCVHCFPGAVVGLKYHGNLAMNTTDIPGGYSMLDFKQFLRKCYNLKIKNVFEIKREKPILILISRQKSRKFLNEDEMVAMLVELGFQVVVTRPERMSNLNKFAKLLNSCSVLVGAHGAGLTNEVFLPSGAVVLQVVPLGLEWASTNYFSAPARGMGVQYLEYKIEPEESSV
ncbi:Glycosyltransferase family 61 protein [Melia azedarach]|uniref:Glycosyltransferase family 61 protein n=1 Tax=Melia azedarach TaxID=155640 RepID=A0ACC1YPR2_MELAZ|nr:Glycosyltransferase family 61 protein [Melia azedarach]